MNVFALFESKDINNIKLGLKVVKSLNIEKEFEIYFKKPFIGYEEMLVKYNNIKNIIIRVNLKFEDVDSYMNYHCSVSVNEVVLFICGISIQILEKIKMDNTTIQLNFEMIDSEKAVNVLTKLTTKNNNITYVIDMLNDNFNECI